MYNCHMNLRECVQTVQEAGLAHGFTLIVVGGGVVRLIGKKTAIVKIDEARKSIILKSAENPTTKRGEDEKTIVDIDCIAFSNDPDPFTRGVKEEYGKLVQDLKNLQKSTPEFPAISLEPVLYHPYFKKPNILTQFVSSIESYHDHDYFFRLGNAKQDVQTKSLDFWTLQFQEDPDCHISTFLPQALQRRYEIRGFAIKPKDKEKIYNSDNPFAQFVTNFRIKTKGKYDLLFPEWDNFALLVQNKKEPSMQIKRALWKLYWMTIGTYLAHGTGFVGKLLLPLGNTFFAGK